MIESNADWAIRCPLYELNKKLCCFYISFARCLHRIETNCCVLFLFCLKVVCIKTATNKCSGDVSYRWLLFEALKMAQIELYAVALWPLLFWRCSCLSFRLVLSLVFYFATHSSHSSTDYKQDGKFLDPFALQFVFNALAFMRHIRFFSSFILCFLSSFDSSRLLSNFRSGLVSIVPNL